MLGYFIKQVWGNSATHGGSIHFGDLEGAQRLAHSGHQVLLYETGYRKNGSRCLFGVGTVPVAEVRTAAHISDGTRFDYWLPFDVELELPVERRRQGIPWREIAGIIGRPLFTLNKGGVIALAEEEFNLVYRELLDRSQRAG